MEGGDTWAFDSSTTLHNMFGLSPVADGSADLLVISGVNGTFTEGLVFSYTGGNSYIDRLDENGGYSILKNNIPEYSTAIAYENLSLGYRTIGASHDLGGLQGDGFNLYIDGILEFFSNGDTIDPPEECMLGDINNDGTLDITDVVRQINIVLNIGDAPTEEELCSADINGDGVVNVLDIISVVNLILDA